MKYHKSSHLFEMSYNVTTQIPKIYALCTKVQNFSNCEI